jgi:hypothetical protein
MTLNPYLELFEIGKFKLKTKNANLHDLAFKPFWKELIHIDITLLSKLSIDKLEKLRILKHHISYNHITMENLSEIFNSCKFSKGHVDLLLWTYINGKGMSELFVKKYGMNNIPLLCRYLKSNARFFKELPGWEKALKNRLVQSVLIDFVKIDDEEESNFLLDLLEACDYNRRKEILKYKPSYIYECVKFRLDKNFEKEVYYNCLVSNPEFIYVVPKEILSKELLDMMLPTITNNTRISTTLAYFPLEFWNTEHYVNIFCSSLTANSIECCVQVILQILNSGEHSNCVLRLLTTATMLIYEISSPRSNTLKIDIDSLMPVVSQIKNDLHIDCSKVFTINTFKQIYNDKRFENHLESIKEKPGLDTLHFDELNQEQIIAFIKKLDYIPSNTLQYLSIETLKVLKATSNNFVISLFPNYFNQLYDENDAYEELLKSTNKEYFFEKCRSLFSLKTQRKICTDHVELFPFSSLDQSVEMLICILTETTKPQQFSIGYFNLTVEKECNLFTLYELLTKMGISLPDIWKVGLVFERNLNVQPCNDPNYVCPILYESCKEYAQLSCGHKFDVSSINKHFDKNNTNCPMCRQHQTISTKVKKLY